MSVSGISASSLAATIQQMQTSAKVGTSSQTTVEQAVLAPLRRIAAPSGSADQGRSDKASASGPNRIDTLV